jgi:hypothetical protein
MHPYIPYSPYNSIISYPVKCICGIDERKTTLKSIVQCTECGIWHHKDCLKNMAKMPNFICPKCQIVKGCLFYNILYTLLEPALFELEPRKNNQSTYAFIPDLKLYPKIGKVNSNNPVFILIRCLKFDKKGFSYHWPKLSKIYLNDKLIIDFTLRGSKKQDRMICLVSEDVLLPYDTGIDGWSRDSSSGFNENYENFRSQNLIYDANIVIIEDYIYDKRPNRLEINVNYILEENLESTNFAVSIDCCEIIRDPEEIIRKVPVYREKRRLKELLTKNEDENTVNNDTLSTLLEKINLMDLYTETERIKLPSRGINCCHLNVFDLRTFLLLNRKTNKYQCPYCKRYSINLYIDGIILDFLNNKKNYDVEEILIDKEHNILSYIHKKTNLLVNHEKKGVLYNNNNSINKSKNDINNINNKNKKELFDINKKFEVHLNQEEFVNNNYNNSNISFFSVNKDVNIISNFSQIFDMMKNNQFDLDNNDKDKNVLYMNQKENIKYFNFNEYLGEDNILNKYPKKDVHNDNKENNLNNVECEKVYDLMGNKKEFNEFLKNKEWIIPLDEEDDNNKNNKKNKNKDIALLYSDKMEVDRTDGLFKDLFN